MSFDSATSRPTPPMPERSELDHSAEDAYWRARFANRPYVEAGTTYEFYAPAYRFGWESRARDSAGTRTFEAAESELQSEWSKLKESAVLAWDKARHAVRDAWDRMAIDRAENEGMGTAATHSPEADQATGA